MLFGGEVGDVDGGFWPLLGIPLFAGVPGTAPGEVPLDDCAQTAVDNTVPKAIP